MGNQLQVTAPADYADFRKDRIEQSIASLFEHIVRSNPDGNAVKVDNRVLTYRKLNEAANRIAHEILSLQPFRSLSNDLAEWETNAEPVAVFMEQGVESIVAIIGLLKAGKIFVSIDPNDPNTRNGYILKQAPASVILSNKVNYDTATKLAPPDCTVINIEQIIAGSEISNPNLAISPLDPALLVYTSGSTGQPKGVIHSQRNLLNDVRLKTDLMKISPSDRISLLAWGTGQAIKLIFTALLNGATLHPFNLKREGVGHLSTWLKDEKISLLTISAPIFRSLLGLLPKDETFPDLRLIRTASDTIYPDDILRSKKQFGPHCFFINALASNETGMMCANVMNRTTTIDGPQVPIGHRVGDVRISLLDESGKPAQDGSLGAIAVTSRHIARGYWRSSKLTRTTFSYDTEDSEIVTFQSADLARMGPDGSLELAGRRDFQVKIRGYRVDLAEVEAALLQHKNVIGAVTHPYQSEQGEKQLIGYVVPKTHPAPSTSALHQFLKEKVTDYMIPAKFVVLDKIPLLPTGKTNRRALPEPGRTRPVLDSEYVAPRTDIEKMLVEIWSQVIGIDQVGIHDPFMELGGDSLKAGQVMARIIESFGLDLPLRMLFETSTIAEIAIAIEQSGSATLPKAIQPVIERLATEGPMELSFGQKRMWFYNQLNPDGTAYNMPKPIRLTGKLNVPALSEAIEWIISRHDVLRTNYPAVNGIPQAIIADISSIELPLIDLRQHSPYDREVELQKLMAAEAAKPIDLEQDLKLWCTLYQLDEEEHVLLCLTHHIASDGWSRGILMRELAANYEASVAGEPSPLSELPIQYSDFARWQLDNQKTMENQLQMEYWKERLQDIPSSIKLPTDHPRPAEKSSHASSYLFTIPKDQAQRLTDLATSEHVTMFMLLLAGFNTLLYRYSKQEDLVVGCPIAGRSIVETEELIGFFVNTLVIRNDLSGNPSFRELLNRVREQALGAYAHQDIPFDQLVGQLNPERDKSRNPLFQIVFDVHKPRSQKLHTSDVSFEVLSTVRSESPFDQAWNIAIIEEGLLIRVQYDTDLFEQTTIERMARHFETLLNSAMKAPDTCIADLPMVSEIEKQQMLVQWNDTARYFPGDKCLHQLFEEQVKRTPDSTAAIYEDQKLSYEELNRQANQLAGYLNKLEVGQETLVGLCVDRSLDMLVGMLGILKAGGAFVPLDPSLPPERLEMLVEDVNLKFIILASQEKNLFSMTGRTVLYLDQLSLKHDRIFTSSPVEVSGKNAAYVLFTSGSTGRPKAVLVEHRQWMNYVQGVVEKYDMEEPGVFAMVQPLTVDSCQTMIFPALIHGSTLHIISREHSLDASRLAEYFQRIGVDYLKIAPSHLWALLSVDRPERLLPGRHLIVGGESFQWKNLDRLKSLGAKCQIWNHYGPTETTVGVLTFRMDQNAEQLRELSASVPIGRPLANVRCYVMDRNRQPVPLGFPGELYIGGDSVVRGYLNRANLTEEMFVEDPFTQSNEARLYRTGDKVRWLPSGVLEFLGREDSQVKLRGFRIELGEIESILEKHPLVAQAVVLLREDVSDSPYIAAYLVLTEKNTVNTQDVRLFLESQLPEVMIPSAFVFINEIPRTQHGKADRKALPIPELLPQDHDTDLAQPASALEEEITAIWRKVLEVDRIGLEDNFFQIGGHSLKAMRTIALLNPILTVELKVRDLFDCPTVASLAERILKLGDAYIRKNENDPDLQDMKSEERIPLSFAQKRLWFLHQLEEDLTAYNMPTIWSLSGSLNVEALRRGLDEIVARHEPYRTVFASYEGQPFQVIQPPEPFKLPIYDLRELPAQQREEEIARLSQEEAALPFDLASDRMLRAKLLCLSETDHRLLLTQHHIASDAWSDQNLWKELKILYEAFEIGAPSPLPELESNYSEFGQWQRDSLNGEAMEDLTAYWRDQLKELQPVILPTDHPHPETISYRGAEYEFTIEAALVEKLKHLGQENRVTPQMMLLAAFQTLLSRYSGQDDIVIGIPTAGRLTPECEPLIGFFINTVLVRGDLSGDPTVSELLKRIQETSLDAYDNQEMPFDLLVEELQPDRNSGRNPLLQVMFQFIQVLDGDKTLGEVTVNPIKCERETSHFELQMHIRPEGVTWKGTLGYSTDLFEIETIQRLAAHYVALLESMTLTPESPISKLSMLSKRERRQLLKEWSGLSTIKPAPYKCVFELFEDQAGHSPEAVALVHGTHQFTFKELNSKANHLAFQLLSMGVTSDTTVGVWADRSPEVLVGILAILKAGACYLPLDPGYPSKRLNYMLKDSATPILLALRRSSGELTAKDLKIVFLDDVSTYDCESHEVTDTDLRANRIADPKALAYVIYTSGSTGTPKGVAMPHEPLVNLLSWQNEHSLSGRTPRTLQYSSLSFDVSFQEIFSTWCSGGTLVMVDEETRGDLSSLWNYLCDEKIERLFMPFVSLQMLAYLVEAYGKSKHPEHLREIITAGEQLRITPDIKKLFEKLPDCRLCNQYGPTESHVVTFYPLPKSPGEWSVLPPIGRPITNTVIRILDDNGQPVPVGVTGELYIGGQCLARGYLNDNELTQEKFDKDPFDENEESRLYRSGDLASWQDGGNIEFLGRIDSQIKIRGYRVETGEIETALAQQPDVGQCVVIGLEDDPDNASAIQYSNIRLIAYIVPVDGQHTIEVEALKSRLKEALPDYMIPSTFITLEEFPLSPTGKIDRKSLPTPANTSTLSKQIPAESRSMSERIISEIWTELLKVEEVGLNKSFFHLGGHSLLAMRVIARIQSKLNIELRTRELFDNPTVRELASLIDRKSKSTDVLE